MTPEEIKALRKGGIIIATPNYGKVTQSVLSPHLLLKYNWSNWPSLKTFDEIFHNTSDNSSPIVFMQKDVGLKLWNNGNISVSLSHPMSKYWLSILQPIWDEQNKNKCQTCRGSGWDGETYTLTCMDCAGSGKITPINT